MVDHFRAFLLSQIISHEVVIKVPVNKTPVDHLQGFVLSSSRTSVRQICYYSSSEEVGVFSIEIKRKKECM